MIIPIKCFTCNKNLASKYSKYIEIVSEYNDGNTKPDTITNNNIDEFKDPKKMTIHEKAFILLNLNRYCCRRHLLSEVNIIDKI